MSKKSEIVPDDTGQEAIPIDVPAPGVSPSPVEQAPSQDAPVMLEEPRRVEFGDRVRYVDGERTLDATVQVAFTDGTVNLRVEDDSNAFGYFDVYRVVQDVSKTNGTFHYAG